MSLILKIVACTILALLGLVLSPAPANAEPAGYYDCLGLTPGRAMDTSSIIQGLGLTRDQSGEVRTILIRYDSGKGPLALTGLGLTAEQIRLIKERVAADDRKNDKPAGYPCPAFKNPTKVIAFMRAELIDNGFRPRMTMTLRSPRQVQFVAIQDGVRYWGTVAKYGPRLIKTRLTCTSGCSGGTYSFQLGFDA